MIFTFADLSAEGVTSCPLVEEIVSFFPVLEGYVVEVKEDRIILDLSKQSGVKKGMEFLCIREGEEFTHPITGDVLGRFEDKLGFIQISEIEENYSIGKILQNFSGKVIKRGDKIRITTAKIPIAFPPDMPSGPILDVLVEGLSQSGRFTLVPGSQMMPVLREMGEPGLEDLTPLQIQEISEKIDLSAIILPGLNDEANESIMKVRIISAHTGTLMAEITSECIAEASMQMSQTPEGVPASLRTSGMGAGRFVTSPQGGISNMSHLSKDLPVSIRYMAMGDITGNGKNEICITDGRNLYLYAWEEESLIPIAEVKGGVSEDHLSLDIADINGNGCAEIFVSNMERDALHSFVLEWQENGLKRIWEEAPIFLRVMPVYPGRKILLGQRMGMTEPFDPHIFEYKWEKDGFVSVREMDFPSRVNIFDTGMADLDEDGTQELISLDRRLRIYRNGEKIWESDAEYGAKTQFFEHKPKGALVLSDEEENRIYLSSHIQIQDMNGNGRPDIMLIRNISSTGSLFPRSRLFRKGEVCLIEWNGISFSEVWCSGQIDAYLTDLGIGDINSDNDKDLVLSMVLISGIGKFWETSPSKILFY